MSYRKFLVNGIEITDLKQWCDENNTRLIKVRHITKVPNILAGRIVEHVEEYEMPETFLNCMRFSSDERYERVEEDAVK